MIPLGAARRCSPHDGPHSTTRALAAGLSLSIVTCGAFACGAGRTQPTSVESIDEPTITLEHRLGDGALLQYGASSSVVVRIGDTVRERSARARFDLAVDSAASGPRTDADLTLRELVVADERVSVSVRAASAQLTIPGSPMMSAAIGDSSAMRRLDSLASTFGIDLTTRARLQVSPRGALEASSVPGSVAGLAAFAALLTPELPSRRVRRDSRWQALHRPYPVDLDASCRAQHELVALFAGRAHVRWRCEAIRVTGIEGAARGTYVLDLARGVVVELDGRIGPSSHAGTTETSIEATYSVHLDE